MEGIYSDSGTVSSVIVKNVGARFAPGLGTRFAKRGPRLDKPHSIFVGLSIREYGGTAPVSHPRLTDYFPSHLRVGDLSTTPR